MKRAHVPTATCSTSYKGPAVIRIHPSRSGMGNLGAIGVGGISLRDIFAGYLCEISLREMLSRLAPDWECGRRARKKVQL
jgi:hypothetical protein